MSVYTTTGSVTYDQTAYDRYTFFALRETLIFDGFADVKPVHQAMPGSSVVFHITADLSVASSALDESTDVDAVALSDSNVTVTLREHGNVVQRTAFLGAVAHLPVDPVIANVVGYNAGESINALVSDWMSAGSNVRYSGSATGRTTVIPTATLTASNVRRARADLRGSDVRPWYQDLYAAVIHPDVAYDLRTESGTGAWRVPREYVDPAEIYNGEIGTFEGFRFIENSNAPVFADAGSSTTLTDVYGTLFFGRQALAKAFAAELGPNPVFRATPVIDKLSRFTGMGWYHIVGYQRFRAASLRRVESASSIGANA